MYSKVESEPKHEVAIIEREFKFRTRRIFAFTRVLCLGETLVLLDVVSQHMANIVT